MAFSSDKHGKPTYQQVDYVVRNRLYYGLLRGTMELGTFLDDEKLKMQTSDACCYCGAGSDLTLDHLIPRLKGGADSADNLIVACRSCNSSKKALDLMEWMSRQNRFPPLQLLRRYLKLAIRHCLDKGLMDAVLSPESPPRQRSLFNLDESDPQVAFDPSKLPFAIKLLPHSYPAPNKLVWWTPPQEQTTSSQTD